MNRREFIQAGIASAALAILPGGAARAIGVKQRVRLIQIRHGGNWEARRGATVALAEDIRFRTSIDIATDPLEIGITDGRFSGQAMAFLSGDRGFRLGEGERTRLKQWIGLGGLLVVDNAGMDEPSAGFDAAVRRECAAMFLR